MIHYWNMAITISVGNSYSAVRGLDRNAFDSLKRVLSYSIDAKAAFFSGAGTPRRKYLMDSKGSFPTGLLHRVVEFLDSNLSANEPYSVIGVKRRNSPTIDHRPQLATLTPRTSQIAAIGRAKAFNRGIISMPTGTGKSIVIAMLIAEHKVKTLVVVPNLSIKEQLISTISQFMGDMTHIVVENIDSPKLKTYSDFDMLIVDEAHHSAAKTYQRLNKTNWNGIYYRYFFTATPFRNNPEESLLFEGIAGQIIYQLSYKQAVADRSIVPVEAFYIELPKVPSEAYSWAEVYSEHVVRNSHRNQIIADILLSLKEKGQSVLCLVKEIAHGKALSDLAGVHFANGEDENTSILIKAFNANKINALIGTNGVIGEGVDTKPCEWVIIAGLGKAKSSFMQQVGRGVRTYPGKDSAKIILIKDKSHRFLIRHFKSQCDTLLEEYGVEPIKLDVS